MFYNFYIPRFAIYWEGCIHIQTKRSVYTYKFVLFSLYYTHFIAVKSRKKKKNKDSSHNLRLSASIIVFSSRKLTSFLSKLFMPIPRAR